LVSYVGLFHIALFIQRHCKIEMWIFLLLCLFSLSLQEEHNHESDIVVLEETVPNTELKEVEPVSKLGEMNEGEYGKYLDIEVRRHEEDDE